MNKKAIFSVFLLNVFITCSLVSADFLFMGIKNNSLESHKIAIESVVFDDGKLIDEDGFILYHDSANALDGNKKIFLKIRKLVDDMIIIEYPLYSSFGKLKSWIVWCRLLAGDNQVVRFELEISLHSGMSVITDYGCIG